MSKLKTVIVDDEINNIEVLELLLSEYCPEVELVATATSGSIGLEIINEHKPHVVFLDIEMPGITGLDILKELPNRNFHTIIITAYEHYAIPAMKLSAIDYLLKPVDEDELKLAVAKVDPRTLATDPRMAHFQSILENPETVVGKIIVASRNGYQTILENDITYLEANPGNYCLIHLLNGKKVVVTKTLSHFEGLLSSTKFYRIHRSHIVNINQIIKFDFTKGEVSLRSDEILSVSFRKRAQLKKILTNIF